MTYHKIRGVEKTVCTAEQKIAYNLASAYSDLFQADYNAMPMQFQKHEVIHKTVNFCIDMWKGNKSAKKYDIDAIFCALNAGLENYIKSGHPIIADYAEIGKMFPADYL